MTVIRGILFDKDGTLLDFNSMWIPIAIGLTREVIKELEISSIKDINSKLLNSIGVTHGIINPSGVLSVGTVEDIKVCFASTLVKEKVSSNKIEHLEILVADNMKRLIKENAYLIKPIGDLPKLFDRLKKKNIILGLATSDTFESAKFCLKQLGVFDYFSFIGGDDGILKSKPHPDLLNEFCFICGLEPEEIAVVGDTPVDLELARNGRAGMAIAVLSGTNKEADFPKKADIIIPSVECLVDEKGKLVWE